MYKELEQRVDRAIDTRMNQIEKDITAMREKSNGILEGKAIVLNIVRQVAAGEANKRCPCCQGREVVAEMDDANIYVGEDGKFVVFEGGMGGDKIMIGEFMYCPICGRKFGEQTKI